MNAGADGQALDDEQEQLVADRYRIEQQLAKGGMGTVYRAYDPVRQRAVALKRLREPSRRSRQWHMFEREYRTLKGLSHPRIIEVFDFGIDARGAYYTMELLDGRDLRELAPLPPSIACGYLRDVATSLALLHARRLLHRDLSPRNVRITSDGRAKLIDFGALSGYGRHSTVVGTPPLVPPEALTGQPLDHRADLYSLGALAYWMLVGRHAYDIKTLPELSPALRNPPPPPSQALDPSKQPAERISPELDDLVMSLLSRDPLARPASAAEVIERLSSVARLPADRELSHATSYLLSGKTVGRARTRARLRGQLKSALEGKGRAVMLDSTAGMGATRLLSDLVVDAQLRGAVTAYVDARTTRGALGVAQAIVHAVFEAQPRFARLALGNDDETLAPFLPGAETAHQSRVRGSGLAQPEQDPRELRLRQQRALVGFLDRIATELPIAIAVNGLEQVDESSAALLYALSQSIAERPMLLVLGRDPEATALASSIVSSLAQACTRYALPGLSPRELRVWIESMFGPEPGAERLAEWLHQLSGGNPQACIDLCRHLIDTQVVRFVDGVWAMPQALSSAELPTGLEQVIEARVSRLSQDARTLGSALSVDRGVSPRGRCLAVAQLERVAHPEAALEELIDAQVVMPIEGGVRFSHERVRAAFARRQSPEERQRLHRVLGSLLSDLSEGDPEKQLDAGWHLLHGGEEHRGAELLARAGQAVVWDANAVPAAVPALRAALEVFRKQPGSEQRVVTLVSLLVVAGFYSDRTLMERYGDEALEKLGASIGLARARKLERFLGGKLATILGIALEIPRFVARYGIFTYGAMRDAIIMYATVTAMMTGLGTITLDGPRAQRYAQRLAPLAILMKGTRVAYDLSLGLTGIAMDRWADALERLRSVLEAARKPIPLMPEGSRRFMYANCLYAIGNLEALCEDGRALERAIELDGMGSRLFEMYASQIRALFYGLRGEADIASAHRARVELYALQAGSSWQAEVWAPGSRILACELTHDLVEAKRVMEQLDRLASDIPSLRRFAALARSSYHKLRGDSASAMRWREPVLQNSKPREFNGWATMISGHVHDCARTGQLDRALADGRAALASYDSRDALMTTSLTPLQIELALAEADAGQYEQAAARIDEALAAMGTGGGPATRGNLHEARARIALLASDFDRAHSEQRAMEACFRPTRNPVLIARAERLRRGVNKIARPHADDDARDTLDLGRPVGSEAPPGSESSVRPSPARARLRSSGGTESS